MNVYNLRANFSVQLCIEYASWNEMTNYNCTAIIPATLRPDVFYLSPIYLVSEVCLASSISLHTVCKVHLRGQACSFHWKQPQTGGFSAEYPASQGLRHLQENASQSYWFTRAGEFSQLPDVCKQAWRQVIKEVSCGSMITQQRWDNWHSL